MGPRDNAIVDDAAAGYWVILFERAVHRDPAEFVVHVRHRVMGDDVAFR
jgi:hypothetical protein